MWAIRAGKQKYKTSMAGGRDGVFHVTGIAGSCTNNGPILSCQPLTCRYNALMKKHEGQGHVRVLSLRQCGSPGDADAAGRGACIETLTNPDTVCNNCLCLKSLCQDWLRRLE
jgi:hypothetical protein